MLYIHYFFSLKKREPPWLIQTLSYLGKQSDRPAGTDSLLIVNISEIIQVGFLSNIEILLFIITNSFLTLD